MKLLDLGADYLVLERRYPKILRYWQGPKMWTLTYFQFRILQFLVNYNRNVNILRPMGVKRDLGQDS